VIEVLYFGKVIPPIHILRLFAPKAFMSVTRPFIVISDSSAPPSKSARCIQIALPLTCLWIKCSISIVAPACVSTVSISSSIRIVAISTLRITPSKVSFTITMVAKQPLCLMGRFESFLYLSIIIVVQAVDNIIIILLPVSSGLICAFLFPLERQF
jgi:hypothetical protein